MTEKLLENKYEFEKDILEVLKKYGFATRSVTRMKVDCKVDCLPEISLTYLKQDYCLRSIIQRFIFKIKNKLRYFAIKTKYLFKNVR